ncbi:MAG: 50S ribosomal protein L17 [Dehalococcoidia bacterium]|nr:50S ribosomal protein L17 [Dehalococcoidia bacterium]
MRHNVSGRKFDRPTAHRLAMYRNLVQSLMSSEKIVTTEAKAKEVRSMAEKMITLGKKGDLSARRRALAFIYSEAIVDKVFDDIAKRYADRNGGYTRITKMVPRLGDGAPMAQLELVK